MVLPAAVVLGVQDHPVTNCTQRSQSSGMPECSQYGSKLVAPASVASGSLPSVGRVLKTSQSMNKGFNPQFGNEEGIHNHPKE